jgi:hypothetical protein
MTLSMAIYPFFAVIIFYNSYNSFKILVICPIFNIMGIGDWGLGIGDWGLGPIPNPQSPL